MTCPACDAMRIHTADEREVHHPLAGHGYQEGQGWSCPAADQAHVDEARASKEAPHVA